MNKKLTRGDFQIFIYREDGTSLEFTNLDIEDIEDVKDTLEFDLTGLVEGWQRERRGSNEVKFYLEIKLTDDAVFASRCCWTCTNITTGYMRLNLEYIKSAIKNKNKKATKYNWANATEKWLLITASSSNLSNNAGPARQNVNWADPKLLDLCCESLFDRIVFWERVRSWYKWLKPSEEVVVY